MYVYIYWKVFIFILYKNGFVYNKLIKYFFGYFNVCILNEKLSVKCYFLKYNKVVSCFIMLFNVYKIIYNIYFFFIYIN